MATDKVPAIGKIRKVKGASNASEGVATVSLPLSSDASRQWEQPVDSVEISDVGRALAAKIATDVNAVRGWRVTP